MKTIVLNEPGFLAEKDAPFPPGLGENEVLLKARCPGICGTELHALKGANRSSLIRASWGMRSLYKNISAAFQRKSRMIFLD